MSMQDILKAYWEKLEPGEFVDNCFDGISEESTSTFAAMSSASSISASSVSSSYVSSSSSCPKKCSHCDMTVGMNPVVLDTPTFYLHFCDERCLKNYVTMLRINDNSEEIDPCELVESRWEILDL